MAKQSNKTSAANSATTGQVAATSAVAPWPLAWLNTDWSWGFVLLLIVVLAYVPVWWAGYVWDDDFHLTANPCIVGPLGLKEIWTTKAASICPLVLTTYWLVHALWGLNPLPYHVLNVLLHGMSAIVLWRVLRSLQVSGAWLGAAIWALHPVQAESVAWVTEMKNTQSCLFYLLSILFFVRCLKANATTRLGKWTYGLTLLFAALAMASKSSTVILPVVLCLCAWWVEGQWHWRTFTKVMPVFFMAMAAGLLPFLTLDIPSAVNTDPQWMRTWPERLVTAGDAVWFYLAKLLWPHPLMLIYPRWKIDAGNGFSYLPLVAVGIVLLVLWLNRKSWARSWFFVFAYFLTALAPVLGLVDNTFLEFSFVADHFQYLADMAPLALVGFAVVRWANFFIPGKDRLHAVLAGGLLLVLGMMTWHRASLFQDEEKLWTDTLLENPKCWVGYYDLGLAQLQKGQVDRAMAQFQKALEINPHYAQAHNNLGGIFFERGQLDQAMAHFQKALEIEPNLAKAHFNIGVALNQQGKPEDALLHYQKAVEIDPDYADAHLDLGLILAQKGQVDEAIAHFQKALEIRPNDVNAHNDLGGAYFLQGRIQDAIIQFQEVLRLNPGSNEAKSNLAKARALENPGKASQK